MSDEYVGFAADEEPPGSPMGRTLLTVVGTVLALAVVAGIVLGVSLLVRGERTESATVEVDPAAPVRVVSDGVDLRLVPTDGQRIEVDATIVEGLLDTDFSVSEQGGDVLVSASCQAWLVPDCGADVTVGVPRDMALEVSTGTGDVVLEGLTGVVTVESGSGDVQATALAVLELDVTTDSGDVDVAFAEQPYGIKARTDSGDVAVAVPDGDIGYDAHVSSGEGDVDDDVTTDVSSGGDARGGFLTIETASGDVSVRRP